MQVQNCPDIVPTTTPQNNQMVRSVVSVNGDEYDEPIAVDNISMDPVPSRILPVLDEQVWGQWQGTCQQFASHQPCNNGNMIGFESRECIAKDPAQCEGPFFRYCTLNC
uniref:BPTI/Kunitz inhibitor domain-containing protein n=1 Tax=Caenorhabditis tropicalis TaxID=1561998 RepID=A0A1I7T8T4_9PELO